MAADFGCLQLNKSAVHRVWFNRLKSLHAGERPTYGQRIVFETFPFPKGFHPKLGKGKLETHHLYEPLADASLLLEEERRNWMYPTAHFDEVDEPGGLSTYFKAIDEIGEKIQKTRTLTELYNKRPVWLQNIHNQTDEIVLNLYGLSSVSDDIEILRKLFDLNQKKT